MREDVVALVAKLPDYDPAWGCEAHRLWWDAFNALIAMADEHKRVTVKRVKDTEEAEQEARDRQ